MCRAPEEAVKEALRDFANWIYKSLEAEYWYRTSDEAIDDAITGNDYTFDVNGKRAD